jgi:acyl-CoA dehydrogenase family member 9
MATFTKLTQQQLKNINDIKYINYVLGVNDPLRLCVSTCGIFELVKTTQDSILKLADIRRFPGYFLREFFNSYRISRAIKKNAPHYLYLWEHVHPSLSNETAILERIAVKFMLAVKYNCVAMSRESVEKMGQMNLKRLADISMEIYALNSSIARASRSYSIGLKNSQHDLNLTMLQAHSSEMICDQLFEDIVNNTNQTQIVGSTVGSNDNVVENITDKMMTQNAHACSHSILRNY